MGVKRLDPKSEAARWALGDLTLRVRRREMGRTSEVARWVLGDLTVRVRLQDLITGVRRKYGV